MKVRVVGWGVYGDTDFEGGVRSDAADAAVIDSIKENGYLFNAEKHLGDAPCAPILNDGRMYRCMPMSFGTLMAEAHGINVKYAVPHFVSHIPEDAEKLPSHRMCADECVSVCARFPEDRSERFSISSSEVPFFLESGRLEMLDEPRLRYAGEGDILKIDGEDFIIKSVHRKKDLTSDEERAIDSIIFNMGDSKERKAAMERYRSAPTVLSMELEIPDRRR